MPNIPIDWSSVNWLYFVLLLLLVFFCALIGNVIAFKRVLLGAVLATLLFAAGFFWTYYPHNLPLPTSPVGQKAAAPVQATPTPTLISPSPPAKPNNPVRDITSPSTGVH